MTSRHLPALFALLAAFGISTSASIALAGPGTCKCNSGCHANAGQCLRPSSCSLGYEPTCGYRDGAGNTSCPKVDFISCNGDCTCVPIPNFCETHDNAAEYCVASIPDSGNPVPDAAGPNDVGTPSDGHSTTDVGQATDTGAGNDASSEDDSSVPADADGGGQSTEDSGSNPSDDALTVPGDAAGASDTPGAPGEDSGPAADVGPWTPSDSSPVTPDALVVDGALSDDAASCVPLQCPSGTKAFALPGECDPYCAQPCTRGELPCDPGFACVTGFCIPTCVATGCGSCQSCSLGGGECFANDQCSTVDAGSGPGGPGNPGGPGGPTNDAANGGSTSDGALANGDGAPGGGAGRGDGSTSAGGDASEGPGSATGSDEGGCGCRVPRSPAPSSTLGLALAGLIAGLVRRRRRDR